MGGNLFKLGRIPKEKYLLIEQEIKNYLSLKLGLENYRIPRYYINKPDFGDMDIIVPKELRGKEWRLLRSEIVNDLGITRYKAIGAVFSTAYQNFQVDYFLVERKIP